MWNATAIAFGSLVALGWSGRGDGSDELARLRMDVFGEGTIPASFRLVDTQQTATGAVLHVYERAGDLKYGEMEVGQETVIFDSGAASRPGDPR